jgi:asparagine synthase (glutamine-hydrolysing)
MSGGLDSSIVASVATRHLKESGASFEVRAHTVVYDTLFKDEERHYAGLVARYLGIPIEFLAADNYPMFHGDEGAPVRYLEPLQGHVQPLLIHHFNRQVAAGSRVALTGLDGDAALTGHWPSHFAELWGNREFVRLSADAFRYARAKQNLLGAFIRRLRWPQRRSTALPIYPSWLNPAMKQRLHIRDRFASLPSPLSGVKGARQGAYSAMSHPNWLATLESLDAGATRVPLERRHPLLDLRVVQFLLSLPAVPWCVDKHILRASAYDLLPRPVLRRPKTALGGDPVRLLLRQCSSPLRNFPFHPVVGRYIDESRSAEIIDETGSETYWFALRVVILSQWLSGREGMQK